jgi:pimeloyl-ACP methyl ester carboxylesterase
VPGGPAAVGLYFEAPKAARTILHFHGNGEQVADLIALGRAIRARGLGFYAMEYPGYGSAEGAPSEQANYAAAEATIEHLATRHGVGKQKLVLQGQSLGTGIAIEMAKRGHGSLLVLLSPYTSMVDMGKLVLPIFPGELLILDRYLNLSKAQSVSQRALVIHGTLDEVIPASMGKRVAEALPHARLHLVEGGHHNDLFVHGGRVLLDEIERFCRSER